MDEASAQPFEQDGSIARLRPRCLVDESGEHSSLGRPSHESRALSTSKGRSAVALSDVIGRKLGHMVGWLQNQEVPERGQELSKRSSGMEAVQATAGSQ